MGRGNSREGGGQGVICIARGRPGRSTRSTAECSRRGWPRRCSPARWGSPRAPRASPRRSQGCRRPRNSRTKSFVPRPSARSRPGGTWRWPRQAKPPPRWPQPLLWKVDNRLALPCPAGAPPAPSPCRLRGAWRLRSLEPLAHREGAAGRRGNWCCAQRAPRHGGGVPRPGRGRGGRGGRRRGAVQPAAAHAVPPPPRAGPCAFRLRLPSPRRAFLGVATPWGEGQSGAGSA